MTGNMTLPTSTVSSVPQNNTPNITCHTWTEAVAPVYILFISVLGIVLNAFILLVFCLHKKPCTVPEIYLSNLAAADLILVCFLPFWAVYILDCYNWTLGLLPCKVINLCIHMNAYCSIYFLVLVSIDRYVAVVHTMSCSRMRRTKFAKMLCLLVWVFGLLLSIPTVIYRETVESNNKTHCYLAYSVTANLVNQGILTFIGLVIPIPIISFCAFKIVKLLMNRESLGSQNKENKASYLILSVLLAFLICWLPFHVTRNVAAFANFYEMSEQFISSVDQYHMIFAYLAFFNSVLNPILYVIVGKNFRKKVCEVASKQSMTFSSTVRSTLRTSIKLRTEDTPT